MAGTVCFITLAPPACGTHFSQIGCVPTFLSKEQPILDFTFGRARFVEGFAADGVAAFTLKDSSGNVVATIPVISNIYSLPEAARPAVATLAAVDVGGRELYSAPVPSAALAQ